MPATMEVSALENAYVVLYTMKVFGIDEKVLLGFDPNEANNQFNIS